MSAEHCLVLVWCGRLLEHSERCGGDDGGTLLLAVKVRSQTEHFSRTHVSVRATCSSFLCLCGVSSGVCVVF